VPLRRLSNAEYNYTIRDLTSVDLQPAREFPADGAAGEGFTNAAEALSDMSPTLLNKYFNAAKDIADHAVFLPDGFRFSPAKTRRDWTDESLAALRKVYGEFTSDMDGRLPLRSYLLATIRHRGLLADAGLDDVAKKEKLNAKYLHYLWRTLTERSSSPALDRIRARWAAASEKDVDSLLAEIEAWQRALWQVVPIGSYRYGNTVRQVANNPAPIEARTLRVNIKPVPGQSDVVLYLSARDFSTAGKGGNVIWQRPRFEGGGKPPVLLRDYDQFGPRYEINYPAVFADTHQYLAAAFAAARDDKRPVDDIARERNLDVAFLHRWVDLLALEPGAKGPKEVERIVPIAPLELLDEKTPMDPQRPAINGWRKKGTDLPSLVTNSSDQLENIPGRAEPHKVVVHPTPTQFVAATWTSPIDGTVRISAHVIHAHPACGNGIAWWLEHRHADKAAVLNEGAIGVGGQAQVAGRTRRVSKGDVVVLAVDARDNNHVCDLTQISFTIAETDKPNQSWDLARDVANNVLDGNPHADKLGNKEVWRFVLGPTRPVLATGGKIPPDSVLGRWRSAAADASRHNELPKLAEQVTRLLAGARPGTPNHPDLVFYDSLVTINSPLLQGLDLARWNKPRPGKQAFGLDKERFGKHPLGKPVDDASLVTPLNSVVQVRLPAALFFDREFVVEGKLDADGVDRVVDFQALPRPTPLNAPWDGKSLLVAPKESVAFKQLLTSFAEFRNCFPLFICHARVIPVDEVVCLKLYHREDEPLERLFLNDEQKRLLDRLWAEHRFISQQPLTENKNLPLFIGFVTQDQPKELLAYFEGQRDTFRKRAEDFEKEIEAAVPKQLETLLAFAARAYRRPLQPREKTDLEQLYATLRSKAIPQEESLRTVLARVLVSPSFLFRVEHAPAGKAASPVNDWELASRLSYFLWATMPDEPLRQAAASGKLRDPQVLAAQTRRMLKDDRLRALAIEFGTQWLHIRGFDAFNEKNEQLFPTFDAKLRQALYEESILFFQDLFQNDRSVTSILDADYTFLNESLAKHYGIPNVTGPQWRKVDGVKKYGRGGILALASVQAKESGASRTSPVLRGNWVVETLLGEKLPRPPPNVPRLPEEEKGNDGLTMRQLVEKHTKTPECAVCHVRIDPFGFAFEKYDPIGRLRAKDLGGLPVDARARLKDGTEFEGIDGLRNYLLAKKKDVVVRLFCRRLLGYALGRAVTLSDQLLIDEMVSELNKHEGHLSAAVLTVVKSPQFRMIRGSGFASGE
jgi:hypothetical protein